MKFAELTQEVQVARAQQVHFDVGLTPGRRALNQQCRDDLQTPKQNSGKELRNCSTFNLLCINQFIMQLNLNTVANCTYFDHDITKYKNQQDSGQGQRLDEDTGNDFIYHDLQNLFSF